VMDFGLRATTRTFSKRPVSFSLVMAWQLTQQAWACGV
jgi:hypothetical protein